MTYNFKLIVLGIFAAVSLLPAAPRDERNTETFVTLTAPVEIQGVLLQAGTYLFKLVPEEAQLEEDDADVPCDVVVIPPPDSDDETSDLAAQDDNTGADGAGNDTCEPGDPDPEPIQPQTL